MTRRDQISARYFNQTGITLLLDASAKDEQFDLLNNVDMIARVAGAPDNSEIHVRRGAAGVDSLVLSVSNTSVFQYPSEYILVNEGAKTGLTLLVESIYVRQELQGAGIGTRSVMVSLAEAAILGFRKVALFAAGSATKRAMFFGYHVWPSMGFDAPLPPMQKRRLPKSLAWVERISDLIQSEEGSQWWYDNGVPVMVEFDLEKDSVSWQLLHRYAKKKGIRI
jgi:GNAT superfamily N-acetyltransferase